MSEFKYFEPMSRIIGNSNNKIGITESGDVGLMCPECFNTIQTHINTNAHAFSNEAIVDLNITINYNGFCPICKESVQFETIDINMSQIINILNNKGYYTAFCCEGHINDDMFNKPYIYFYFWEDSDVLKTNPLPDTWIIDELDLKARIFNITDSITQPTYFEDENDIIEYNEWVENNWNQRKSLEDIYNWAVSLPDKDPEIKEYQRNIIRNHSEAILEMNAEKHIYYFNNK